MALTIHDFAGYGDRPVEKESPGFSAIADALDAIQLRRFRKQQLDDEMKRAEMQNARIREVAEMQEAGEMARSRAARALEARKLATEGFTKSILPELQKDKPHAAGVQALGAMYGVPVEPIIPQGPQGPRPELAPRPMTEQEQIMDYVRPENEQFMGTPQEQADTLQQQKEFDARVQHRDREAANPSAFRVSVPGMEDPLVVRSGQVSLEKNAFADKVRSDLQPLADMYKTDPSLARYVPQIINEVVVGAKIGDPPDKVAKDFRDLMQEQRNRLSREYGYRMTAASARAGRENRPPTATEAKLKPLIDMLGFDLANISNVPPMSNKAWAKYQDNKTGYEAAEKTAASGIVGGVGTRLSRFAEISPRTPYEGLTEEEQLQANSWDGLKESFMRVLSGMAVTNPEAARISTLVIPFAEEAPATQRRKLERMNRFYESLKSVMGDPAGERGVLNSLKLELGIKTVTSGRGSKSEEAAYEQAGANE